MGIEIGLLSAIGTIFSAYQQSVAQDDARDAASRSAEEQRRAKQEAQAGQAQHAALERRAQLREERIRRARLLQSSENTGVTSSSGALGGVGNLSTQLGSNLGFNLGQQQKASNITNYNQSAADFLSSAQNHMNDANMWGQVENVGASIFKASGGFNTVRNSLPEDWKAPGTSPVGPTQGIF